jgi:hypothetical protein
VIKRLVLAAAVASIAFAQPATAADVGFETNTKVDGITLSVSRDPPHTVFTDASALSPDSICQITNSLAGELRDLLLNGMLVSVNNAIRKKTGGVTLVRYDLALSPNCNGWAAVSPIIGDHADYLVMKAQLPGNRFTTNLTTPDADVLGVKIGAPQSADPRISVRFDVDAEILIPLPADGSPRFGAPQLSASVRNVSLPQGENPTGDVLAWLADVGSSIYDYFNNGLIGKTLATGGAWNRTAPNALVSRLNDAIQLTAADKRQVAVNLAPGSLLSINFNNGEKLVDPTCISGFVWREARKGDLVCVTPEVRAQVREDNRLASQRAVPIDAKVIQMTNICMIGQPCEMPPRPPQPCLSGFVWREAVENDYVCVTPATREQAKQDNIMARRRRVDFEEVIH